MDFIENSFLKIEGFGPEVVALMFAIFIVPLIGLILYGAWKISSRRTLDYEVFIIEMHTLRTKRIVVVIHVGSGNFSRTREFYSNLIERIRERTRIRYGNDFVAVSDTNVVVNAPTTMADLNFPRQPTNRLTMWEIEVPSTGNAPDNARDGERAAAVAICVLSRAARRGPGITRHFSQVVQINNRRVLNVDLTQALHSEENQVVEVVQSATDTSFGNVSPGDGVSEGVPVLTTLSQVREQVCSRSPENEGYSEEGDDNREDINNDAVENDNLSSNSVTIRIKFLDDTQIETRADLSCNVMQFRNANFRSAVEQGKVVRLIFKGQLLRDDFRSLESYGLHDGCVVHCHISTTPYAPARSNQPTVTFRGRESSNHDSQNNIQGRHMINQTEAEIHEEDMDRYDQWFFRAFIAVLTNTLFAAPAQFVSWSSRAFMSLGRQLTPTEVDPNEGTVRRLYRRLYYLCISPWLPQGVVDPVDAAARAAEAAAARPFCIGDYLMWIFGIQCALVWTFVYNFPQLCDRTAFGLLILLTLYFFFVVVRSYDPRRRGNIVHLLDEAGPQRPEFRH